MMWRNERAWGAFRRLEEAGGLRLRVLFHPPVVALPDLVRRGQRSGTGSGLAVTVHAIGDAAVRRALDLLEGLPRAAILTASSIFSASIPPTSREPPGPASWLRWSRRTS